MCPQFDPKSCGSLKKAREKVVSQLEEMRKLKTEKKKQFAEVLYHLKNISIELHGSKVLDAYLDENNLSLKRLEELQKQLLQLQNEKVVFSADLFIQTFDRPKCMLFMTCSGMLQCILLVIEEI